MTATVDDLSCQPGPDAHATARRAPSTHVLDHAVWQSLIGQHAHLAERRGRAARYRADVAPLAALENPADPQAWADAAELLGPGGRLLLNGVAQWPEGWQPAFTGKGVQMIDTSVAARPDPEAVPLGPDDVPDMLALVERTAPGPFLTRTIDLGAYLGIRRDGALVAMAGERLHPPGWTEISAVCTATAYRGQGLATRLVRAVAAGIRQRGETPFLHAVASNTNAIRLYESIGFTLRRRSSFTVLISPSGAAG